MDARITKQRLGNMLSYDWLKILIVIAAAITALCVLFTMVGARPTNAQTFTVYGYYGTNAGTDFYALEEDLALRGVFSYDILKISSEKFTEDRQYGTSVFTVRRSAQEGSVMFVSNRHDVNEEGVAQPSVLDALTAGYPGMFLDPERFLNDCETYLARFFGAGWTEKAESLGENWRAQASIDEAQVEATFLERNGKDRRFRSRAKKAEGVLLERERIFKLSEDYLAVKKALSADDPKISFTDCTVESAEEEGKTETCRVGFDLSKLGSLHNLIYYTADGEEGRKTDGLTLVVFDNGEKDGMADLKFEAIGFIRYLLARYGA